jgi:hypothetical protein
MAQLVSHHRKTPQAFAGNVAFFSPEAPVPGANVGSSGRDLLKTPAAALQ